MKPGILLVEDNASIVKLVGDLLTSKGYEVTIAQEAEEVLRISRECPPHLVLIDMNLPQTDGLDLTRRLKREPSLQASSILAFTAASSEEDLDLAREAGCDGCISKPIQIASFLAIVESHLRLAIAKGGAPSALPIGKPAERRPSRIGKVLEPLPAVAKGEAPSARPIEKPAERRPSSIGKGLEPLPAVATRQDAGEILVVDDNPNVVKLLSAVLELEGYRVRRAFDGKEALEAVRKAIPDLVVVDVTMPQMNGYQVCRRLKADEATRFIPVVMLTAHGDSEHKILGIEAGADDFVNKPFNKGELLARIHSLMHTRFLNQQLENAHDVILALARAVEARDQYTGGHTERVSTMAVQLGKAAGLDSDDLDALNKGGFLHDLGKIEVPDHILNKPGPLTAEEWTIMRRHPVAGGEITRSLRSIPKVIPVILHHHERLDGSGYPMGLKGSQIPITVRIVSIVDVYDALTTRRSYKPAFSMEHAAEVLLEEAGKGWWDEDLVKLFLSQRDSKPDSPTPG